MRFCGMIKGKEKCKDYIVKKRLRCPFPLVVSHLWYQRATVMATNGRHQESSRTFQFVNWHDNVRVSYILTNRRCAVSSFHLSPLLLHRIRARMIKTRNHTVVR